MAKRAPILGEGYNPVGARLRSALLSTPEEKVEPAAEIAPPARESEKVLELHPPTEPRSLPVEDLPVVQKRGGELKESYIRFRSSEAERKKWHDIAREITGEHNQLSHVMRACLLVLENSYEHLQKVSGDIQRMKRPSSQDGMGLAIYEQRMAQYLFDAIKAAGRPKG